MTQAPEPPFQSPPGPPPAPAASHPRLYQVAAWVVIVAGIVFIVAIVFFSGVWAAGGGHPSGTITTAGSVRKVRPAPMVRPRGRGLGAQGRDPAVQGGLLLGVREWVRAARVATAGTAIMATAIGVAPKSRPHRRRARKPGGETA